MKLSFSIALLGLLCSDQVIANTSDPLYLSAKAAYEKKDCVSAYRLLVEYKAKYSNYLAANSNQNALIESAINHCATYLKFLESYGKAGNGKVNSSGAALGGAAGSVAGSSVIGAASKGFSFSGAGKVVDGSAQPAAKAQALNQPQEINLKAQ